MLRPVTTLPEDPEADYLAAPSPAVSTSLRFLSNWKNRLRRWTPPRFLVGWIEGTKWLRRPPSLAGQRVCLLASFSADGAVSEHTAFLADQWRRHGFKVVLIMASTGEQQIVGPLPDVEGILLRRNAGYDFGSWACGIRLRPDVRRASLLALANDSVYGPLQGFGELLERVLASSADAIGMTDSHEVAHHIQSYLVFYRPAALKNKAFTRFWKRRILGGREDVIWRAEIPLMGHLLRGGLRVEVLFESDTNFSDNPTLVMWRELLDAGFPFVKVQLLRENPLHADLTGWEEALRNRGFDPELVRRHLGSQVATASDISKSTSVR